MIQVRFKVQCRSSTRSCHTVDLRSIPPLSGMIASLALKLLRNYMWAGRLKPEEMKNYAQPLTSVDSMPHLETGEAYST